MKRNVSVPQVLMIALGLNLGMVILAFIFAAVNPQKRSPLTADQQLAQAMAAHQVTPFTRAISPTAELFTLGQALFFDPLLSGNSDVSCATCHHPNFATGDGLPLSIGVGGTGLGPDRIATNPHTFIPRHAPELFNRNSELWTVMFWDGRVAIESGYDGVNTPAAEQIPTGLANVFVAQAMFPVTSRDEMRGERGDSDIFGAPNELAELDDDQFVDMWEKLIGRILAYPAYESLFTAAFPSTPASEFRFEHAATAIAAFEMDAFTFTDSPWDRYVAGDLSALTAEEKEGALLFFGAAGCGLTF